MNGEQQPATSNHEREAMKVTNAVRKLERAGWDWTVKGVCITFAKAGAAKVIQLYRNGGEYADTIACIRVRRMGDLDNPIQDYSAGAFVKTIKAALALAE